MYTLYKFHFLNGISEINQLFDDILIIWPAPVLYKRKDPELQNITFRESTSRMAVEYMTQNVILE